MCLVSLLAIAVVSDVLVAIDLYMRSRPAGPGRRPLFKSLSKQQVSRGLAAWQLAVETVDLLLSFVSPVIVWHLRALLACGQMVTLATGSLCFTGFVILLAAEVRFVFVLSMLRCWTCRAWAGYLRLPVCRLLATLFPGSDLRAQTSQLSSTDLLLVWSVLLAFAAEHFDAVRRGDPGLLGLHRDLCCHH